MGPDIAGGTRKRLFELPTSEPASGKRIASFSPSLAAARFLCMCVTRSCSGAAAGCNIWIGNIGGGHPGSSPTVAVACVASAVESADAAVGSNASTTLRLHSGRAGRDTTVFCNRLRSCPGLFCGGTVLGGAAGTLRGRGPAMTL